MTTNDTWVEWNEDRGGLHDPRNLLSVDKEALGFYEATEGALPWDEAGSRDPDRVLLPVVHLEALFGRAPCNDPNIITSAARIMTHTLSLEGFLQKALEVIIEEGLLTELGHDEEEVATSFDDFDALVDKADRIVGQLQDHPGLQISDDSFEWLDQFTDSAQYKAIKWFHELTISQVLARTHDLSAYSAT